MKKVIVPSSSKNPVKLNAAKRGFERMFPDEQFEFDIVQVVSGVSDQPMSDEETRLGAQGRAINARAARPEADYWIGMEGGLREIEGRLYCMNWVAVIDRSGRMSACPSGAYQLPTEIEQLVRSGLELGEASDRVFNKQNIKHTTGTVGVITNNVIDREEFFYQGVVFALAPFKNWELYFS